jgi:hypothetical protein
MFSSKRKLSLFNVLSVSFLVIALVSPFIKSTQIGIIYFELYMGFSMMILIHAFKILRNYLKGKRNKVIYLTTTNMWSLWIWLCTSISNEIISLTHGFDISTIINQAKVNQESFIGIIGYYDMYILEIWFSNIVLGYIIFSLVYFVFAILTKRFIIATNSALVVIVLTNFNISTIELDEADQLDLIFTEKSKSDEIFLPQMRYEATMEQATIITNLREKDLLLIHKLENEPPHLI